MGQNVEFDIPSLRQRMLAHLGEKSDAYPNQLEKRFPHVLAKLVELWGKPAGETYLDSLMFSDRPNRAGFPVDVASELLKLSMIHGVLNQAKGSVSKGWQGSDSPSEFDDFFNRRGNRETDV